MGALRAIAGSTNRLTLRLSMATATERPSGSGPEPTTMAAAAIEKAKDLSLDINALSPTARAIVMELRRGDDVHGIWTFTARDLNVPIDPEAFVRLQNRFGHILPGVRSLAAQSAYALSEKFPSVVKLSFLEELRQRLSAAPSLPLYVCDSLKRTLDTLDRDRTLLWLEFTEPIGFLPWLAWEQMLRETVGVPVVRTARQPVDALAPRGSLDVLVVVTAGEPIAGTPKSVVGLCREILKGLPAPHRCVIHLCADVVHRDAVRAALAKSGLTTTEGEEPPAGRGVAVYPFPAADYLPSHRSDEMQGPAIDVLSEHQWPQWIRACMRGRGIDVIHIISEAGFPTLSPCLEVAAIPWKTPDRTTEYFFRKSTHARLRHVDAPQITELTSGFGAWAVIQSAPSGDALRAQRALAHQISGLVPGVFVVHDIVSDPDAAACGPLYAFLSRSPTADGSPRALPDSTALCIQCHPSRFLRDVDESSVVQTFGASFVAAAKEVSVALNTQEATPAWAAVLQRTIEQSVAGYLAVAPANDRDKAAQDGVVNALTKAMEVLAKHTKSTT